MSIDSNAGASQPRRGLIATTARATGAAVLAAPLAWLGYSALGIDHNLPLPPAIDAEQRDFTSPIAGRLSYYVEPRGSGRPLVLVHSINAGASAYEMRPLFDHYRSKRPVYALDLPGFGLSNRSDRAYSPELYTAAIVDLLQLEIAAEGGVDLVALSLSAEFAAFAALNRSELVRSLALISPTGFSKPGGQNAVERSSRRGTTDQLYRVFSFPLWSQAFYDLLVSRPSLRYFLQRAFVGPVDQGLLDYDYLTTHRPGARYAPLYFVSGKLFSPDIRDTVYERLRQPALVLYDRDANIGFNALPGFLENHLNWHTARITPTLGLPHWEKLAETTRALDTFWEKDVVETR